jgi:hypothetical protein
MAIVKPGPSNGSTALIRTAAAPPADPALHPQPRGVRLRYSVLLSTGS